MEKFLALPAEKQTVILDAAMSLFGAVGYKKASIADIAAASGISKAMVFYYFGSKKALYLYLIDVAGNALKSTMSKQLDPAVTDFFEKIRVMTEIKISALRQFPGIFSFLATMYYETDKEVVNEIKRVISDGESFASTEVISKADTYKFKDGIDPELVFEILTNYAEGYITKISLRSEEDIDKLINRFYQCVDLMKNNLYKEEYKQNKTI